jgi:predicted dehydrogenase
VSQPIGIGLVGYGYWGPNLARNFAETKGANIVAICDTREELLSQAKRRHPAAIHTPDFNQMIASDDVDAVVIATPTSSHADLAIRAMRRGKHVLVAKPLAATSVDARSIEMVARETKRVLMVDHTFVYTGAVQKVKELVAQGELGDLFYFDSVRVNLGLFQHDVSVLWDLAVHDLSIIDAWLGRRPRAVSCIAVAHVEGHPQDVAYLTLLYEGNFVAHVHVNWLSPVKVRRTLLGGAKKMVLFDDLDPVEKIKVYDRGITRRADLVGSSQVPLGYRRTGDVWSPQLDMTEALSAEASHFLRCIRGAERPLTNGESAVQIIEILEAAEQSMQELGRAIPLN